VLILSAQALFAESLSSLLQRDGSQVVAVRPYDDSVAEYIETLKPTVVVLDMENIPPGAAAALLDCAPNIRIVHVSLTDQVVEMYDHQRPPVPSVQEFLDFVAFRDKRQPGEGRMPDTQGEVHG
jgi:DNA-binding NarL/FixJ family response regulator